jgi:hypothetical protein
MCNEQLPVALKPSIEQSQNSAFKRVKIADGLDSKLVDSEIFNKQILQYFMDNKNSKKQQPIFKGM